jgi:hypothetical protein
MKKLIFITVILLIGMVSMAQTKIGTYGTFAGTAADTLTASATKSYTLEFKSMDKDLGANIQLFTDLVSGTATFGWKLYYSNDGTNWPATAADSVAAAKSHASDFTGMIAVTTVLGRYAKLSVIATSATQKSTIYGYVRTYAK